MVRQFFIALLAGQKTCKGKKEAIMVSVFTHEGDHNTNEDVIKAIQEGKGSYVNVEIPAYEQNCKVLKEIRDKKSKNDK